jgi:uncharacterized protein YecE (DUF72 family)
VNIYLGTQGWSYADWVGSFYPPGTRPDRYLSLYTRSFDAVELDTTFYGIPSASRVATWRDTTPPDFVFTAKLPRSITHDRRLVDAGDELRDFLQSLKPLGAKLGAVLIQLPPDFSGDERPALEGFLALLPGDVRFAAEFRHRSWLNDDTFDLLRRHHVAWTIADLWYMPVTPVLTTDFTYLRLLGNRRQITRVHTVQIDRRADLERWAEELERFARDVERVYGFVNNHYSGHSPADVRTLRHLLGMPEERPNEQPEQGSLL